MKHPRRNELEIREPKKRSIKIDEQRAELAKLKFVKKGLILDRDNYRFEKGRLCKIKVPAPVSKLRYGLTQIGIECLSESELVGIGFANEEFSCCGPKSHEDGFLYKLNPSVSGITELRLKHHVPNTNTGLVIMAQVGDVIYWDAIKPIREVRNQQQEKQKMQMEDETPYPYAEVVAQLQEEKKQLQLKLQQESIQHEMVVRQYAQLIAQLQEENQELQQKVRVNEQYQREVDSWIQF